MEGIGGKRREAEGGTECRNGGKEDGGFRGLVEEKVIILICLRVSEQQ